jgi:hypothetical protein
VDISSASLNIQGATVSVGLLGGAAGDDENGLLENSRWGFFANGDYAFGNENRGNDGAQKGGDRNFDFNFFTSIYRTKAGKIYYYLYDQGYLELENDYFLLIKKNLD